MAAGRDMQLLEDGIPLVAAIVVRHTPRPQILPRGAPELEDRRVSAPMSRTLQKRATDILSRH